MLSPALAVTGTLQQPVDQPFVRIGPLIREKGGDLFGTRR